MFISSKNDLQNHLHFDDSVYLPKVALPFKAPLFLCEVDEYEAGQEEPVCSNQYLVSDVDDLATFAKSNKISSTYLLSPGFMNKTGEWAMKKLMRILRADYIHDDCCSHVYRFEFEQDIPFDHDISGRNKDSSELFFKSILQF